MQAGNPNKASTGFYLAAGLQAGMFAALLMLLWLGLASRFYQLSFWTVPNLFAAAFHGEAALRPRFLGTTWSGLALYLIDYGLLGAAFAAAVKDRMPARRVALLGILVAIGWYYLSFGLIWKKADPLLVLYFQDRPMFLGHVGYGALLGRFPAYLRRLWKHPQPAAAVVVTPGTDPSA